MNLGEKLFELRKSKNLTQDDVSEKLNVTRQTVSKWETNQTTPDFDKIVPLCELYNITPNELLIGEEQEKENERGEDNENMTNAQIKQKSAEVVSSSILIFFIAIAYAGIGIAAMKWNPIIVGCTFLVIIGWGVARIVKHYISIPKIEKTETEKKEDKIIDQIEDIVGLISTIIYFIVSFATMAWHITWIIFVINGLIVQIVKLIFTLKEENADEE